MSALQPIAQLPPGVLVSVAEQVEREQEAVRNNARAARAATTLAAYEADFAAFVVWCQQRGYVALPATPKTVEQHIGAVSGGGWRPDPKPRKDRDGNIIDPTPNRRRAIGGLSPASAARLVAAIAYHHKQAGLASPTASPLVRDALAGLRRRSLHPSQRKQAATTDLVRAMLDTCGTDMQGLRDRALLSLGFAGALRRSELVALDVADLEEVADGYRLTVRRSKTDQFGVGVTIAIGRGSRLRPVAAVQDWLRAAGIGEGAIFRQVHRTGAVLHGTRLTSAMVAVIVKRRAKAAGLDVASLSGHSLRAGFITSAAENGANIFKIMEVSRHQSMDVMKGYVRSRELFKDYAGETCL